MVLRAQDHLSGPLKNVSKSIQGIEQHAEHLNRVASNIGPALASLGAGAAMGEFVRSSIGAAITSQSENARVMTAMMSDGAKATAELVGVQRMAIETSSKLAITQDQLKESYTLARYAGLDNTAALVAASASAKLAIGTTRSVTEAQAQMAETTRMISASFEIFGDKAKAAPKQINAIADSYALLQSRANFANAGELNSALTEALGSSGAYGVGIASQNAILETLVNFGKFGSKSGEAYEEVVAKLSASNKYMAAMSQAAGGDVIRELGMIKAQTQNLDKAHYDMWAKEHGFEMRSVQGLTMLLRNYDDLVKANRIYAGSAGAGMNQKLFNVRSNDAADKLAIFANNLDNLKEALGAGLLPMLTQGAVKAAAFVGALQGLAEAYPTIAKVTLGFLGITAAITAISGTLQLLGIGKSLTYAWSAATKVLTAAQWLFNGALAANPIAIAIISVAALSVAAYELYEHWAAVKAFFKQGWLNILFGATAVAQMKTMVAAIKNFGQEMYAAGANLMHSLAAGIVAGAMAPIHAVEHIGRDILDHFKGHSPPPLGPLHELNQVRLVETIAATIKPAPMLEAIHRVAQVAAIAIPMIIAAPAMSLAAPVPARNGAVPGGAPVINYAPQVTIHAVGGDPGAIKRAVLEALRESINEVHRILDNHNSSRARTNF